MVVEFLCDRLLPSSLPLSPSSPVPYPPWLVLEEIISAHVIQLKPPPKKCPPSFCPEM